MPDHSTSYINNKKSELTREITTQLIEIENRIEKITGKWPPHTVGSIELKDLQEMKKKLSIILNNLGKQL
jgi:hypothetical protein